MHRTLLAALLPISTATLSACSDDATATDPPGALNGGASFGLSGALFGANVSTTFAGT